MRITWKKIDFLIKSLIIIFAIFFLSSTSNESLISNSNINHSLTLDLESMVERVRVNIANDIYSAKETYSGYLTGYVATCPLCSGHLSCLPKYDVLHGVNTYDDSIYGNVNIVASSTGTKCGTIVRINNSRISSEPIYAIVLDRGVGGNNLDFLVNSENDAYEVGRSIVSYDILRNGW